MTATVGIFEAKTKLSALVERVERGEELVITRRGKPVAKLVPPDRKPATTATVEDLMKIADAFGDLVEGEFTSTDIDTILYDEEGLPK